MPRALALMTTVSLVLTACGSKDATIAAEGAPDDGSTTTSASVTTAPPEPTLPVAYTALGIDLDVDLVFRGVCMAWSFDIGRDHSAINDVINDFLANQPDGSSLSTHEQRDNAVRAGCAEDSAVQGVTTALDTLSLESPAIAQMIDDACLRYARTVAGEPGAQDFHTDTVRLLGLDHDELTAMVLDICGTEVFATMTTQPTAPET